MLICHSFCEVKVNLNSKVFFFFSFNILPEQVKGTKLSWHFDVNLCFGPQT